MDSNVVQLKYVLLKKHIVQFKKTGMVDEILVNGEYFSYLDLDYFKEEYPEILIKLKLAIKIKKAIEYQSYIYNFDRELKLLEKNFKSNYSSFKFPGILNHYRKNINPTKALYNELQKVMFIFDINNQYHLWILSLFDNKKFYINLINSLNYDIKQIQKFIKKYTNKKFNSKDKELIKLNNLKCEFLLYKKIFLSIQDWKKDLLI